jgi:hypothetical protein
MILFNNHVDPTPNPTTPIVPNTKNKIKFFTDTVYVLSSVTSYEFTYPVLALIGD